MGYLLEALTQRFRALSDIHSGLIIPSYAYVWVIVYFGFIRNIREYALVQVTWSHGFSKLNQIGPGIEKNILLAPSGALIAIPTY